MVVVVMVSMVVTTAESTAETAAVTTAKTIVVAAAISSVTAVAEPQTDGWATQEKWRCRRIADRQAGENNLNKWTESYE